jgi:dTDP-4-dehydrorhamnose 3,5-epimerase
LKIVDAAFDGAVLLLEPDVYADARGCFLETYRAERLRDLGMPTDFPQDNHSVSARHVVRGLHYQWDQPQGKLVRCGHGAILDVAVDLRASSPTVGQHYAAELDDQNHRQLWLPAGFAHGFLSRTEGAVVVYKCSAVWNGAGEAGIDPFDSDLGIDWGISRGAALLSPKDAAAPKWARYLSEPRF